MINIHYYKAELPLGRMLSNMCPISIDLGGDLGKFQSIEGLWYWLEFRDDHLRTLYGVQAKKYGRELRKKGVRPPESLNSKDLEFQQIINHAVRIKIANHDTLREMMSANTHEFTHVDPHSGKSMCDNCQWWLDSINGIRGAIKLVKDPDIYWKRYKQD